MATKKKKPKYTHQTTPDELVASAQTHLQQGRVDEAIHELRLAEKQLQPRVTVAGKKISTPPHLSAAQMNYPALLASALLARARLATDLKLRQEDLAAAVQYAPEEPRYRIALGLAQLLAADAPSAAEAFAKALALRPDDELALRAMVLTLLATGRTHEAAPLLATQPSPPWQRLAAVRAVLVGNGANGNPLHSGLSQLVAEEPERALETLSDLPLLSGNLSRIQAAQLATQFFYSGALYFTAQRYPAALGDWREAERLCDDHHLALPWRARLIAYYHKTAEAVVTSHLALALDCWDKVLQLQPDDVIAAANLTAAKQVHAQEAWRAGNVQQAIALWREAALAQPQNETLLKHLALAYEKQEQSADAVHYWRELAKVWRKQSKQRAGDAAFKDRLLKLEQHIVKLLMETGAAPTEVVAELDAALHFDPDNRLLRLQIADQLMELGRGAPALKHLETIEKQHGVNGELLVRKSLTFDLLHRPKDALQALERALELEPDNALARQSMLLFLGKEARQADEHNDLQRALELCEKQLALDPNYDEALLHLASLYFDKKRAAEARELLARALALTPVTAPRFVSIGGVYLRHKLKKEAEAVFKQALELDATAPCHFMIGMEYWNAQDDKSALKHFEQAADTATMEMILEIAMCLSEGGKPKDADRYFKLAMQRDPLNPLPHMIKGIAAMGIGDPLAMLMGPNPKQMAAAQKELAEAERLMEGRPEFAPLLAEMRQLARAFEQGPPPRLGGLLGGGFPPDFFDDDEVDESGFDPFGFDAMFGKPKKKKKKK